MDTSFLSARTKDEIKAKLPLAWVCARLNIRITDTGYAHCPFHDDNRPSFQLYCNDQGFDQWHCYPCNAGGDVFSLIMRERNVSFAGAKKIANELLDELPVGYQPPASSYRSRVSVEDWAHTLGLAQQRAHEGRWQGKLSLWHGLAGLDACASFDASLRAFWGWGIEETGTAVIPHWDEQRTLLGCKLRATNGRRWAQPGSKFEHLYGCWLGVNNREVLLCEGETDAVWAFVQAHRSGTAVDVRALPRGAGAPPTALQIDQIRRYKIVYLALDPDDSGVQAARRWAEALTDYDIEVRLCRLPYGKDLRDARPDIAELIASARSPLPEPDNFASFPGGYAVTDPSGNVRVVTHWRLEPKATLSEGDDGPGMQVLLHQQKQVEEQVLRWSDLTSIANLRKWCARRALVFSGSDKDMQRLAEYLQARAAFVPEIFQTDRVGQHTPPAQYAFAGRSVVYPHGHYDGDLPWLYAPGPKKADVNGDVLLPADGEPFDWRWLDAFAQLSDPSVTHTLLSWLCAAARRTELERFPMLFLSGPSGCGKSTLAEHACTLAGSRIRADLGSVTPFILMQRLAATTTLPVFVDEWTRLSRRDTRETMQGLMPVIYAGGMAERGQSDLHSVRYRMTAPVVIAGEDTMHLDREIERVVRVSPRHGWQNAAALELISARPLQRFGQLLHRFVARSELPALVDGSAATRPEHNQQVLDGGWKTLQLLLDQAREHGQDVPELPEQRVCPHPDDAGVNENVYETAVREAVSFRDQHGSPLVWMDPQGGGTYARFAQLLPAVERFLDIELPGRSRAMTDYFRGKYGVEERRTAPPGNELMQGRMAVRAHLIKDFHLNV